MSDDLPESWTSANLSELCQINPKHDRNLNDTLQVSFVPMAAVSDTLGQIETPEVRTLGEVRNGYTHFADGDVIFAKITPCMENGKAASVRGLVNGIACGTTEFFVLRSLGAIDQDYLFYYIRQASFRKAARATMQSGVGQARVPKDFIEESELPLPPLAEQRRIVAKIEALQERSRKARAALAEVGPLLEQFRQSLLAAAFRGDLTADWRAAHPDVEPASELLNRICTERCQKWEAAVLAKYAAKGTQPPQGWQDKYEEPQPVDDSDLPELPEGWCWASLESLIEDGPTNGYSPKTTANANGTPALKLSATTQRRLIINKETIKQLDEIVPTDSKYWLIADDILIQRSNSLEYVGATALYDGPSSTYVYPDIIVRIRVGNSVCRQLLCHLLNSPQGSRYFKNNATGTAGNMPKINGTTIRRTPIPLAPLAEQVAMQQLIDSALEIVSNQEVVTTSCEHALNHLDQSILAKAFRGELVPQDPHDEPAAVLLERIRQQRANAAVVKRKRTVKEAVLEPVSVEHQVRLDRGRVVLDLLLLLEAWGGPVSLVTLEAVLGSMQESAVLKPSRKTGKPLVSAVAGPILRGLDTIYANLVAKKVISLVGKHAYELIDRSIVAGASKKDRQRAKQAIQDWKTFIEQRDVDEVQGRDYIRQRLGRTYDLQPVAAGSGDV